MTWGKCATCLADLPEPVKVCRCGSRRIVEMGEKREPRGQGSRGGLFTQARRREMVLQSEDHADA